MTLTSEHKNALGYWNWEVECESPLEIRHTDGGAFASGIAAEYVVEALLEEWLSESNVLKQREIAELRRLRKKYPGVR